MVLHPVELPGVELPLKVLLWRLTATRFVSCDLASEVEDCLFLKLVHALASKLQFHNIFLSILHNIMSYIFRCQSSNSSTGRIVINAWNLIKWSQIFFADWGFAIADPGEVLHEGEVGLLWESVLVCCVQVRLRVCRFHRGKLVIHLYHSRVRGFVFLVVWPWSWWLQYSVWQELFELVRPIRVLFYYSVCNWMEIMPSIKSFWQILKSIRQKFTLRVWTPHHTSSFKSWNSFILLCDLSILINCKWPHNFL